MTRPPNRSPGRTPSPFRLDLSVAPGNAREFELWRSGLSPLFRLDTPDAATRAAFAVQLTSYQFSDVAIVSGRSTAAEFQRNAPVIARSGIDNISLAVFTKGGCSLDVEGRATEVHVGDVFFLDLSRPAALRQADYESLTLILPRAALQPYVADLDSLHGKIVRKSSPLSVMLANHMHTLFVEAPALGAADGRVAANGTAALISAFAGASDQGRERIARASSATSLLTLRQFIEANLADLDLGPESICRQLGLSRATLFRAFEPMGGVRRYVLQRRLARAHQLLADAAYAHHRVGAIALQCGFSSVSVFSRAFHQTFGMSPTDLRQAFGHEDFPDVAVSGERGFGSMSRWLLGLDAGG